VYEKREGFDALSVQECPDCRGVARRVLTPPALVFKGTGFYVTDNRKNGSGDHGDAAEKPAAAESGSGTEKSETKTETPAPTPAAASSSAPAAQAAAAD